MVGIIDDYVTTGSTLEACRLLLKERGARQVVMVGIGKMAKYSYIDVKLKTRTNPWDLSLDSLVALFLDMENTATQPADEEQATQLAAGD